MRWFYVVFSVPALQVLNIFALPKVLGGGGINLQRAHVRFKRAHDPGFESQSEVIPVKDAFVVKQTSLGVR
jgi:hypothetical protein